MPTVSCLEFFVFSSNNNDITGIHLRGSSCLEIVCHNLIFLPQGKGRKPIEVKYSMNYSIQNGSLQILYKIILMHKNDALIIEVYHNNSVSSIKNAFPVLSAIFKVSSGNFFLNFLIEEQCFNRYSAVFTIRFRVMKKLLFKFQINI